MAHKYYFTRNNRYFRAASVSAVTAAIFFVLSLSAMADPPVGTFYYPPGNEPPGPPPNYNQVDSAYFAGEPSLPLPPPDSGGVYIWVDPEGTWNVANHIYSSGNSLEQFHGSILARMEFPPTPDVNIFTVNFEVFGDTTPGSCYRQNDRWGWYDWGGGLYEIWWDVCTREWRDGGGDPNDFMIMRIEGCAIDFNVWSSGHSRPFGTDQIFLGADKIALSAIPDFEDTYPGLNDPYQQQAGNDPTTDPNITIFTRRDGNGAAYNADGLIVPGQTYPCGMIDGQGYGDRFSGTFVYEGDGIEFSSVCGGLEGPGLKIEGEEIPPLADDTSDVLINICGGTQIWTLINEFTPWADVNIFGYYSDPGVGNNRTVEFVGLDSQGHVDTSFISPALAAGLWLHNDLNGDGVFNGDDALLFSERTLTQGSGDNNHQWFMVYDVSAYKGTGVTYEFFCPTQDYSFTGDFDYLVFIDDDNSTANFDHNDMIVGMICFNVPEITCPPDIEIDCSASTDPAYTGYATAVAFCGNISALDYSDSEDGNIITRTWTAIDDCGASSSCQQIITLVDSTPPEISCPANTTVQCVGDVPAPDVGVVGVTDDCDPNPVVTHVGDVSDGSSCPETISRTYRATDAAGNYSECQQIITVDDNIPPEITCPEDLTILCSDPTDPEFTGYPEVSDNCDSEPEAGFFDVNGDQVITRTWTVTDDCGNSTQCVQTIMIADNLPPIIECPQDPMVMVVDDLSEICLTDIPHYDPDGEIASVEVNGIMMEGLDICFVPQDWGPNDVDVLCTDNCGATAECSFMVIVGACIFLPGDANIDTFVNIADVVDLLGFLKGNNTLPGGECDCTPDVPTVPFYGAADVNGSCEVNVADVVYLYGYLRGEHAEVLYCPLCPPTEGWLPPLQGGDDNIKLPPVEQKKEASE